MKMKRKRICAWFITLAMLLTMLPSALAASFADTRGHWAEDAISRWSDRGVIQGHNGDFEPDSAITRADMAVIIDRIMDYQTKAENKFSDLDNAYYKDPILRVAQAGVMQGDGKNVRPKDKITREEAVSMLARALSVTAGGSSTSFADNSRISSWAMANVAAFAKNGYIAGRSGNRFEPQANITRAEVVKLLDNMISDYITESGTVTPKGTGIVIVKASGVTLNKAKLSGTVILGGKAGEVKATGCEITGKVVKIHNSTLTTGSTGSSSGGSSGGSSSTPAAPSAYPLPKGQETSKSLGVFNYDMTYFVTLTAQDGADIYYEIAEGADKAAVPTTASKKFDTYQYRQIEITQPTASAKGPVTKTYNVKAVAVKNGRTSSVANWNYDVTSIPHHELKVGVPKDWNGSDVPNVTLIQDYDSDKMYLVEGTNRAMVLDAGYFDAEDAANLYETARKIVGEGKPIDLIIGHPHPDHVQMTHQFLCKVNKDLGAKVYVNERGIEVLRDYVKQFGVASGMFADEAAASAAYDAQLATLKNGDVYDMGGTKFNVIELPGHQVAGIMLFDAATGNLFTTDQIGNNRAHITDSFWMQFADLSPTFFADSMDVYLSSLQIALERVDSLGTVKRILTGHNDVVLDGMAGYLDNLQTAVQKVVDEGWSAATPTLRTLDSFPGYLENTKTVVVGDRLKDINWVGINVNKQNYLSDGYRDGNQNKIAALSNLSVHKQGEKGNLLWNDPNFGINVNWQYPTDGTKPTRKNTTSFVAEVDENTTSIEIVPTAASSGAKITINGEAVASGKAYVGKLTGGSTRFVIEVTAKNGSDSKRYTLKVRQKNSNQVEEPYTYTDYDNYTDPFYPDAPGTFTVTQYMALFSDTEGAQIKYTVDGSDPKTSATAKVFDQTKFKAASGAGGAEVKELITIGADTDNWDGRAKQTKVELKAYASKAGMEDSNVVTFTYIIDRMAKNEHKNRLMYDEGDMKVWNVIDYDSDKMYLIKGTKGALLIDAGMAPEGAENLYEYVSNLAGTKEVDLYISHGHPDHTTQIGDFVKAGRKVYINEKDIPMALNGANDKTLTAEDFTCIEEGYQFDLGGVVLDNYDIPGHTPGSMMLLDKAHNILYSSDQLGCNRRSVADSLTLVNNDVRVLLSSLRIFRDKVTEMDAAGEIDLDKLVVWSGHDDYEIKDLPGHLDTLITAAQNIVDYGPETAMRTSVRNTGGSDGASFAGDRYADNGTGHFICMNGSKENVLAGENYTAVDELANLKVTVSDETNNKLCGIANIHQVDGTNMYAIRMGKQNTLVAEVPEGTKSVDIYPTAMSSNATVKVNGTSVSGGKASIALNNDYKEITIEVTAPDGTTKKTYALTVRTHIDPENPYATLYTGEHTETVTLANGETRTFTSYVPEGARESCAGVFVLPNKGESKFDAWKALADSTDTQTIDADWTKQQEKFIVIYLDGLTYGTTAEERAADIDYVNKVYAAASGRTMYCIHEAKNYMVGYGEGGTIAQMAAMDQTAVWAGLATVNAGPADAAWIAENGAKMASSLNGYNDVESSTRKSTIPKNTLPLPVWMIGTDENNANALAYWKTADHITDNDKVDGNITKYTRSADWTADEDAYKINRDTAAYRIWTSESAPKNTESTIWNDFLFGVRRWMADPGGDLRVTKDPIADLHMTRHYEKVGGWMREWYVYVPQNVQQKAPVVFANHGYTLNGGVYAGQTDWHKVADEKGFIVVFPSAIPGSISENGNAPFPAWNIAMDPTRMDEIEFFKYMLDDLKKHYSIDTGRVYATGHSWGSQMTHVLALNEPEMFAAVAPLSGFIFNAAVFEQAEAAKAKGSYPGVPVYMAAGTEGGTEWAICPVPLAEENSSGKTLSDWFALNGCTGSLDWSQINGSNETKGSLAWQNGGAFTKSGRWYTMTCEKNGVPMVQAEIVDYMPHATMPEHSARVWNNWLSHYSRSADGTLVYNR